MRRGYTLVEVVVALAVLMIVVAVVSTSFALNGRVNARAKNQITVQEVAVNAAEVIASTTAINRADLLEQLTELEPFGVFSTVDENTVRCQMEGYVLTMEFSLDGKHLKLAVQQEGGAVYETLVWVRYAT